MFREKSGLIGFNVFAFFKIFFNIFVAFTRLACYYVMDNKV